MLRMILVLMVFLAAGLPVEAKRVALVIGNNAYAKLDPDYQLKKAVNDATAMRDTLQGLGFEVTFLQDANLTDFKKAIFGFSAGIEKGDVAAFYYAGHGAALKGINYFLPSDIPDVALSSQPNEAEIEAQVSQLAEFSVKEALILEHMAKREPQVSLVIVDACRNNPLREDKVENAFRSTTDNGVVLGDNISTAEKSLPEGMIIVYSAGFGQQALDRLNTSDSDTNSPFTRTLLKQLKQPGLGLGTVVKNTKEEVYRLAKSVAHKQTPSVYDQLFGGDVFLNGEPEKIVKPDATTDTGQAALAAASDDVELLKVVAKRFEGTVWADFAASKIAKLEKQVAVLAPEKPLEAECSGVQTTVRGEEKCLAIKETFTDCESCPEMVVVPAGSFLMGSPADEKDRDADEGPQHKVTLSKAFAVGKFEVTRGQFAAFVGEANNTLGSSCHIRNGSEWKDTPGKSFRDTDYEQTDEHPVACVSWDDAQGYVKWLSTKSGARYRLLTEAEWEYAARAGTTTAFQTGKTITIAKANFNYSILSTTIVGSYVANKFGLFDMAGNVWEWTQDCYYDNYRNADSNGKAAEGGDCNRVSRGGGWDSGPQLLRSALRNWNPAFNRNYNRGFRVARIF